MHIGNLALLPGNLQQEGHVPEAVIYCERQHRAGH
jgi:hypothetical protein